MFYYSIKSQSLTICYQRHYSNSINIHNPIFSSPRLNQGNEISLDNLVPFNESIVWSSIFGDIDGPGVRIIETLTNDLIKLMLTSH